MSKKSNEPREGNGWHSGRKHPVAEKVREAQHDKGAALKSARKQYQDSTLPNRG